MSNRLHLYAKSLQGTSYSIEIASIDADGLDRNEFEGVFFSGIANSRPLRNPILLRLNDYFFNGMRTIVYYYKRRKKYAFIWPIGFGFFTTAFILLIAKFHDHKIILEVNEKPYTVGGSTFTGVSWLNSFWRWLTFESIYPFVNGFIVISENLHSLISKYKSPNAVVIRIPILTEKKNEIKVSTQFKGPYLLHAGALSEKKDGILTVLKAFALACKHLRDTSFRFILTSKVALPSLHQQINKIIIDNDLTNHVVFTGHLKPTDLNAYMIGCTMAVVHKPVNEQNKHNFSTKLGDYLSYGIPVIASSYGEMARFLVNEKNAFIVPPEDEQALAARMIFIIRNPDIARTVGNAGRILAETRFHYKSYSQQLVTFLKSI